MRFSPSKTVVLASRNKGKCAEVIELLSPYGIEVRSLAEFPQAPAVAEDGQSFAQNAAKKASQTAQVLRLWTIGEDSGLMVDALQGAPGIYSARYAGEPSDDRRNNEKLLRELKDIPAEQRTARYVCHVAVADPTGEIRLRQEAYCRGRIIDEQRGTNGFGYDPCFLIPEYHRTFGELPGVVKRHLSHRARAFSRLAGPLVRLLHGERPDG